MASENKVAQYCTVLAGSLGSGLVSIVISVAIERYGGILAGALSTAPSLIVLDMGSYFLVDYLRQGSVVNQAVVNKYQATFFSVPAAIILNDIYLFLWSVFPSIVDKLIPGLGKVKRVSLVTAFALAIYIAFFCGYAFLIKPHIFSFNIVVATAPADDKSLEFLVDGLFWHFASSLIFMAVAVLGAAFYCWHPAPPRKGNKNVSYRWILSRSVLAILVRLGAGVLKIEGPPEWASIIGMILYLPVVLTTIMVSVTLSSGTAVTTGSIGPIMLGMTGGGAYAILSCLLLVPLKYYAANIIVGFLLSVMLINLPSYFFLSWRNRVVNSKI